LYALKSQESNKFILAIKSSYHIICYYFASLQKKIIMFDGLRLEKYQKSRDPRDSGGG
jgi:hypothetical protein